MPLWSTAAHSPNASAAWSNSFYYTPINDLPTTLDSSTVISNTVDYHDGRGDQLNGSGAYLHLITFGTDNWENGGAGGNSANYFSDVWPTGVTPSRTNWSINNTGPSTPNPHLYFEDLRQELASAFAFFFTYTYTVATYGDRHAVLWSESTNELVEVIGYSGFSAACESIVTWDLSSYDLPLGGSGGPAGVVAAKIPVAPFHFTYNDLLSPKADGTLGHMLGWVAANYRNSNVWPARGNDGQLGSGYLRAGDVIRLRSDYPVSSLPNEPLKVIARTLQKYGMMLYDKNSVIADPSTAGQANLVPPNDPNWPQGVNDLGYLLADSIQISDFEVVDTTSIAGISNSIEVSANAASVLVNSISSGEIISSPTVIVNVPPIVLNSVDSSELISEPIVLVQNLPLTIEVNSISSEENISDPSVYLPITISLNSIQSSEIVSQPQINIPILVVLNEIDSSESIGSFSLTVNPEPISISLNSITSNESVSTISLVFALTPPIVMKDTFDVTITVNDDFDIILTDSNNVTVVSSGETIVVEEESDITIVPMV